MSHCLNPHCQRPQNPDTARFCSTCGFRLLLGDRYRARKPIGQGGFGRTFLALDEYKPSRPYCVIKQFWPQHAALHDSAKAAELFRQEAVRLEQLGEHPQIPELLAHFSQEQHHYLVQEFIDGANLMQELAAQGAFHEIQIWNLLRDLVPVLQFIHAHAIIHRDVKPQNIIRRQVDRTLVLVDFGAARSTKGSDLFRTGTSIGSPEYVAPEQAIGKATYASDLYSLGVTCIYLLTGTRPVELFDPESATWNWQKYLANPISPTLEAILAKLLQPATRLRYQTAAEVWRDVDATEPTPAERVAIEPAVSAPAISSDQYVATTTEPSTTPVPVPVVASPAQPTWEWVRALSGHTSWVRAVAITPDGEILASGSGDKTVKLWRLATGELLHTLEGHSTWVRSIAISPDGQILASASNDKTIKLWRIATGELLRTLTGHGDWVRSVAFSPDGQTLISGSQDQTVKSWDWQTGKVLQTRSGHQHWVVAVAASPNGKWQASSSRDQTIQVWSAGKDTPSTTLTGHTDTVNTIAFSPESTRLASGSDDNTLKLWIPNTGKLCHTFKGHTSAINSVVFSPDGQFLISGSQDRTVKLWQVETGALVETLSGHSNWVWSVTISADGRTITSGSWDATVQIWQRTD